MKRIAVDGSICCAVQDLNSRAGRTIVFVHGWPLDTSIFECQYDVLPKYGIRCVGVDLRGFGQSDRPSRGYTYDRLADDLCKIMQTIDSRNITLCGFSMGAAVCIRYMARHNGYRVSRLVLMGAAAPSFVQRPGYPYGMPVPQLDALIDQAYNNRPQMGENFSRMCFAQNPGAAYLNWYGNIYNSAAGWSTIQCAESLRDEDLRSDLKCIRVPTAIFHGLLDQVCPYVFAESLRSGIQNSFIVTFERSGHCLFYEERDKCNSALIDFLNTPCATAAKNG